MGDRRSLVRHEVGAAGVRISQPTKHFPNRRCSGKDSTFGMIFVGISSTNQSGGDDEAGSEYESGGGDDYGEEDEGGEKILRRSRGAPSTNEIAPVTPTFHSFLSSFHQLVDPQCLNHPAYNDRFALKWSPGITARDWKGLPYYLGSRCHLQIYLLPRVELA